MSPRTPQQFETLRENKKQLIKDTALELFANEGYHQTSISNIAKQAGISKGLMYNYFESKEALIKDIIQTGIHDLYKNFDPNHDGILTEEEFKFYIHKTFKQLKINKHFWKLFYTISFQPGVIDFLNAEAGAESPKILKTFSDYMFKKFGVKATEEMTLFIAMVKGGSMTYLWAPETFSLDVLEKKIIEMYT